MAVKLSWSSSAVLVAVLVLKAGGPAVAEAATEAETPVVQCEILTVLELRPEGLQRLDAILYDVRSGSLDHFALKLPPGLEIDQAETDESSGMGIPEGERSTVDRKRLLQGEGHLLLTSIPTSLPAGGISLGPVQPEAEVRARYLAVSLLVPADVRLLPEASGTRVSTSDLPAAFSKALASIDRMVVWRLAADGEGARLAVVPLPYVPARDAVIHRRDTTTLMDRHGTLLFFDRFLVDWTFPATLDVALPAGGQLLAARVNDVPVGEPQERGGVVPVRLSGANPAVVEVVSVQEREGLRSGRSQLVLDLPQVTTPVLVHRLRLLVPGDASYRVRRSDLRAVLPSSAVLAKEFDFENPRSNAVYVGPNDISYGNARLVVKVTDNQGSPLPRAGITLKKGDATAYESTNALGVAVLTVRGDEYQLEAQREGFSRVEAPSLQLLDGKSLGLDLTLSPGAAETITAQAAPLRPLSGGEFQKEIDQLMERLFGEMTPFQMSIPDNGKVLAFSGVLPPSRVTVELDVRAKK